MMVRYNFWVRLLGIGGLVLLAVQNACTSSSTPTTAQTNPGYDSQYRQPTGSNTGQYGEDGQPGVAGEPIYTVMQVAMEVGEVNPGEDYYVMGVVDGPKDPDKEYQFAWTITGGDVNEVPESERGRLMALVEEKYKTAPAAPAATVPAADGTVPAAEQPGATAPVAPVLQQPAVTPVPGETVPPANNGSFGATGPGGTGTAPTGQTNPATQINPLPLPPGSDQSTMPPAMKAIYDKSQTSPLTTEERNQYMTWLAEETQNLVNKSKADSGGRTNYLALHAPAAQPRVIFAANTRTSSDPEMNPASEVNNPDTIVKRRAPSTGGGSGWADDEEDDRRDRQRESGSGWADDRPVGDLPDLSDEVEDAQDEIDESANKAERLSPVDKLRKGDEGSWADDDSSGSLGTGSLRNSFERLNGTERRRPLGDDEEFLTAEEAFESFTYVTDDPYIMWTPDLPGKYSIFLKVITDEEDLTPPVELMVEVVHPEANVRLSEEMPDVTREDQPLFVQVMAENVPEFYKGLFTVSFDPDVLSFREAELGEFFDEVPRASVIFSEPDKLAGKAIIAIDTNSIVDLPSGEGALLYLRFKAKQDIASREQTMLALVQDTSSQYVLSADGENVLPLPVQRPIYATTLVSPPADPNFERAVQPGSQLPAVAPGATQAPAGGVAGAPAGTAPAANTAAPTTQATGGSQLPTTTGATGGGTTPPTTGPTGGGATPPTTGTTGGGDTTGGGGSVVTPPQTGGGGGGGGTTPGSATGNKDGEDEDGEGTYGPQLPSADHTKSKKSEADEEEDADKPADE